MRRRCLDHHQSTLRYQPDQTAATLLVPVISIWYSFILLLSGDRVLTSHQLQLEGKYLRALFSLTTNYSVHEIWNVYAGVCACSQLLISAKTVANGEGA
jgi:hypothetical protein